MDLRPDVVLLRSGVPAGILDAKYKRLDAGEFKNHDLYQVLSYCLTMDSLRGMLIYPRHLVDVDDQIEVRNSSIAIKQLTVPLGGSLEQLQSALSDFVDSVRTWSAAG